jgi:hypothetical protein
VPSALYLSHGIDDFAGGLCRIIEVKQDISGGKQATFIRVQERPNTMYNWEYLETQQAKLKQHYGTNRGHPDPDYSTESNNDDDYQ